MTQTLPFPQALHQIDYVRALFHLEFKEEFLLGSEMPQRLRRDLQRAEGFLAEQQGGAYPFSLLSVSLPEDPVALRRIQKPSPPFVLHPSPDSAGLLRKGDRWRLPVLFLGRGVQQPPSFLSLLQGLGELGLHKCAGRFEVVAVEGENASGYSEAVWQKGDGREQLLMPVNSLGYWLQRCAVAGDAVRFTLQTPARLLSDNRPLFRPSFHNIFPFILRRITSLLYTYGNMELADADLLLQGAARLQQTENTLAWRDWRTLDRDEGRIDLGGVMGSVMLSGDGLLDLLWVLNIGRLCNIGKGAAYGSGHYRLTDVPERMA
jgi:hypothetical protein